jgi:hypothetical protein
MKSLVERNANALRWLLVLILLPWLPLLLWLLLC